MAAVMEVTGREYKIMLDQRLFLKRKEAAAAFWREVAGCAKPWPGIQESGRFEQVKKREIVFLDTPDGTIQRNGFVFRQRTDLGKPKTEYTLKCRSPDRYVASGAEVDSAKGVKSSPKFEEDIGAPFVSRYSHSNTIKGAEATPTNLKRASALFPILGELVRDGRRCSEKTELRPTKSVRMYERVISGPVLSVAGVSAEVALILWSDGPNGRPLVAEFSFRYRNEDGPNSCGIAKRAMQFFLELQHLDWCQPGNRTKTQFVYGEN